MSKRKQVAEYAYYDEDGRPYLKRRFEWKDEAGDVQKSALWYHTDENGTLRPRLDGAKLLPFRSERLRHSRRTAFIWIPEGEKCVLALEGLDLPAICGPDGSAWQEDHAQLLRSRGVILLPDNDAPGHKYGQTAAASLHGVASSLKVLDLPGLGPGEDVADWLQREGNDGDELVRLADTAPEWEPESGSDGSALAGETGRQSSHAAGLVELATDFELFHDGDDGYARVERDGHMETLALSSTSFSKMLRHRYYTQFGVVPSGQSVKDALAALEGQALYEENTNKRSVHMRVAEIDGALYVDLGGPDWGAVKIDAAGWEVLPDPPVMFIRKQAMKALPVPIRGGALEDFRPFVNVESDDDFKLIVGYLLCAFRATGPYFVLGVHGAQGSSKSTLSRVLKELVDPTRVPVRDGPSDEQELAVRASNSHLLVFDNMSSLSARMSDAMCRVSSGGGLSKRKLYADTDEIVLDIQRPLILNGISEVATRSDLLDRSIILHLPEIPKNKREDERTFWARFEAVKPRILGVLFDAISCALRELPNTKLADPSRMIDCAMWVTAAESAWGWEHGDFSKAYRANRVRSNETALDASPITEPLLMLLEAAPEHRWRGTASELLVELKDQSGGPKTGANGLPRDAHSLSMALERIEPNLRAAAIHVLRHKRTNQRREMTISLLT